MDAEDGSVEDAGSQEETIHLGAGGLSAQFSEESSGDLGFEEFAFLVRHKESVLELK